MALPSQTIAAIQAAGAAISNADAALKEAVQSYAEQVKLSMQDNPFSHHNDGLYSDWKTVARLSRAVSQVESEFTKIYLAATDLSAATTPAVLAMPAIAAMPAMVADDLAIVQESGATDAKIKKSKKVQAVSKVKPSRPLRGNAAILLAKLQQVLTARSFQAVNRAALAVEIGMAKGSIGAAIDKLVEAGHLIESDAGEFMLGAAR